MASYLKALRKGKSGASQEETCPKCGQGEGVSHTESHVQMDLCISNPVIFFPKTN